MFSIFKVLDFETFMLMYISNFGCKKMMNEFVVSTQVCSRCPKLPDVKKLLDIYSNMVSVNYLCLHSLHSLLSKQTPTTALYFTLMNDSHICRFIH